MPLQSNKLKVKADRGDDDDQSIRSEISRKLFLFIRVAVHY